MISALVRNRLDSREDGLSPFATRSRDSQGRDRDDEPSNLRTEFQRDRDRIVHSKSFRRLKHKTQVFIAPTGDHYVTRLTHTLEVSQIGRTIGRALNLNEDLVEAISLGHDLGHTPFGHTGENELDKLAPGGFRHAEQSLRIVERLEKDGAGLNLTQEVRAGIVNHSKPRGDFLGSIGGDGLTLEAQVCRVADAVAYLNHDLLDAFRAGILNMGDLPSTLVEVLGKRHSQRIDTMVGDIVAASWAASGENGTASDETPVIAMSTEVGAAVTGLREFMFTAVYLPQDGGDAGSAARGIVRLLYDHLSENRNSIPPEYGRGDRSIADYIAGMTDHYAMREAERIKPGIAANLQALLV